MREFALYDFETGPTLVARQTIATLFAQADANSLYRRRLGYWACARARAGPAARGSVTVESEYEKGSTFRVNIPAGTSHLSQQQISGMRTQASTGLGAQPFVEEALRWLPGETPVQNAIINDVLPVDQKAIPEAERPLILLADDNADMREYLTRLLSAHYRIEAVADGDAAPLADMPSCAAHVRFG